MRLPVKFFPVFFLLFLGFSPAYAFGPSGVIPGFYFGNQSVVDAPAASINLTANVQVSFSFQQGVDDLITAVWVHGTPVGACPQYSAIITDDDGAGLPVTTTNLGGDSGNMSNGWTKISFLGPVGVTGGNIYHVILTSQGASDSSNYFALDAYTSPFTQWIPFNQLNDGYLDTTEDTGSGFGIIDAEPVFAVEETANYGNPYAVVNNVSVGATTMVGEVFSVPATNLWVGQVGAYLQRVSSPTGVLNYVLEDLTVPTTLRSGTLATSTSANTGLGWIDVPLSPAPLQLLGSHQYRLWFSSSASSGSAIYKIDAPMNPNAGTPYDDLTFDGTNSYQIFSTNGGSVWSSNLSADLAFRFVVSLPPTVTPTPTNSATRTPTSTPTATPTLTATATPTSSATATATASATPTSTNSATPSLTSSPTSTLTATPTLSATHTATNSATPTATPSLTSSPTATPTPTNTLFIPTLTFTPGITLVLTNSPTPTASFTPSPTPTFTPAGLATATPTPNLSLVLGQNLFDPNRQPLAVDFRVILPGRVLVAVYNIAGEQVVKLLEGDEPAGNYQVLWDGRNQNGNQVGNGVYLVVIHSPDGRMIQKVIVLK